MRSDVSNLFLRCCVVVFMAFVAGLPGHAKEDLFKVSQDLLIGTAEVREAAADALIARGEQDVVPSLVLLMRIGGAHIATRRALEALTGEELRTWREAMHYQEAPYSDRPIIVKQKNASSSCHELPR